MAKNKTRKRKRMKLTTYGEFLVLLPCCTEEHQKELLELLSHAERPAFVCGKETPANLNMITYGQLDGLSRIANTADPAAEVFKILMGIEAPQVYTLNVFDVFGFMNFVKEEVNRINKLFQEIAPSHTSEEIAAGVEDLNFGTFGIIDWYARRMGITNQDEVYSVAWVRIYTCMKNDNEQQEYEKRLNKQYINRQKQRK